MFYNDYIFDIFKEKYIMYPYKIGGFITLYGICVAVGVLACFIVFWILAKRDKLESKYTDFITINGVVTAAVGFFSAALFQAIYSYIDNPEAGFDLFGSGLTFLGGFVGGAVTFVALCLIFRNKYQSKIIDICTSVPLGLLLGHAFGRLGCVFAGCCYGLPTDSWIGMEFVGVEGKVIPTNLIEALGLFVLFIVILAFYLKKTNPYGLPAYLIGYGILRFVIEFWRGDERGGFVPGISPSQFWSLLMIVVGIPLIFILHKLWKDRQAYLKEHPIVEPPKKKAKLTQEKES